jgi:cell division septum initiation protein DivIVA
MRSRDRDDGMPEFDLALWGYHRGQVDRCLEDLSVRLEDALGRLSAVEALHAQLSEVTLELDQLRRSVPERERWAERLAAVMAAADEQAAAQRAQAQREADEIRARALAEARQLPARAMSVTE